MFAAHFFKDNMPRAFNAVTTAVFIFQYINDCSVIANRFVEKMGTIILKML